MPSPVRAQTGTAKSTNQLLPPFVFVYSLSSFGHCCARKSAAFGDVVFVGIPAPSLTLFQRVIQSARSLLISSAYERLGFDSDFGGAAWTSTSTTLKYVLRCFAVGARRIWYAVM